MRRRALWWSVLLALVVAVAGIPMAVACETPAAAGCCCPADATPSDCGMTSCDMDEAPPAPQAALPEAPTLLAAPVAASLIPAAASAPALLAFVHVVMPFDSPPTYLLDCTFRL